MDQVVQLDLEELGKELTARRWEVKRRFIRSGILALLLAPTLAAVFGEFLALLPVLALILVLLGIELKGGLGARAASKRLELQIESQRRRLESKDGETPLLS